MCQSVMPGSCHHINTLCWSEESYSHLCITALCNHRQIWKYVASHIHVYEYMSANEFGPAWHHRTQPHLNEMLVSLCGWKCALYLCPWFEDNFILHIHVCMYLFPCHGCALVFNTARYQCNEMNKKSDCTCITNGWHLFTVFALWFLSIIYFEILKVLSIVCFFLGLRSFWNDIAAFFHGLENTMRYQIRQDRFEEIHVPDAQHEGWAQPVT